MNRIVTLFIIILLLIAMDIYVFQGYKFLSKKHLPDYGTILNIAYWGVPILLVVAMIIMSSSGLNMFSSVIFRFTFSAFVILYLAKMCWTVFIAVDDVVRLARFLSVASDIPNEEMMASIKRSEFIVSAGALLSGSLIGGMVYGIVRGAHNYRVLNRELKIDGLAKEFHGLKILQISDIHAGSFWSKEAVKRGVELINEQDADLVFFTGDLVNNRSSEFEGYVHVFDKVKASIGVFSVLGNHDYGDYSSWPDKNGMTKRENLEQLVEYQKSIGWNLLLNDSVIIEREGKKLAVIGVENWGSHGFSQYGDLEKAYKGSEGADLKLLLSHDPSHWRAQVLPNYSDITATFSGHTHGMQFGVDNKYVKWSPIKYRYPEWADLYQEGKQFLYVNRGFGYLGYPGRLGFTPEITVFELKPS
ncbi:MAG: metallophosphoesterase [Bacteroidia bacterium]